MLSVDVTFLLLNPSLHVPVSLIRSLRNESHLSAGLKTKNLECGGDDHSLLLVVRSGHSLEGGQPLEGGLSAFGLVRDHSPHGAPEDLGRRAEVERAASGLDIATLAQELE